jgi:hypothetical protein
MVKTNPNKTIQRQRTEDEMRQALHALVTGKSTTSVPSQVDDDDVVLSDAIAELIEKRQIIEDVRGFVTTMNPKLTKR